MNLQYNTKTFESEFVNINEYMTSDDITDLINRIEKQKEFLSWGSGTYPTVKNFKNSQLRKKLKKFIYEKN